MKYEELMNSHEEIKKMLEGLARSHMSLFDSLTLTENEIFLFRLEEAIDKFNVKYKLSRPMPNEEEAI